MYNFGFRVACELAALKLARVIAKERNVDVLVLSRPQGEDSRPMRDSFTNHFYVHPDGRVDLTLDAVL